VSCKVKSVRQSIGLLGTANVRALAVSYCLAGVHATWNVKPEHTRAYWEASLGKGAAAKLVMQAVARGRHDEAFTMGLLQDIGIGPIVEIGGSAVVDLLQDDTLTIDEKLRRERELFATDHAACGRLIGEQLKLPEPYLDAVDAHHDRRQTAAALMNEELALAVYVASLFPHDIRAWNPHDLLALDEIVKQELSHRWADMSRFIHEVQDQFAELTRLVKSEDTEAPSLSELAVAATAANAQHTSLLIGQLHSLAMSNDNLIDELDAVAAQRKKAEEHATRDPLTEMLNRRGFEREAEGYLNQARRAGRSVAVALFDRDDFKRVNDTHGHACGDAVLQAVAQRLSSTVRQGELLCRWGGDELVFLCTGLDKAGFLRVVSRLKRAIEGNAITWRDTRIHVAASVGTHWSAQADQPGVIDGFVEQADRDLYRAKEQKTKRVDGEAAASPTGCRNNV